MTYEYNAGDAAHDVPNPYKIENVFLAISALSLIVAGSWVLHIARGYFSAQDDKTAFVTVMLGFALFGTAVTFGVQAMSQIRFFFGRNYPLGLASELLPSAHGKSDSAVLIQETLRQRAIHFPEPTGPLNGILYSLIRPLIVAPPTIQFAAIRHFHAIVGMLAILISLGFSYFLFNGSPSEGVVSWLYLPMTGMSLAMPFFKKEDSNVPPNSVSLMWNLVGLIAFAMLAPVLVPKYAPHWSIPSMWVAPLALLVTSIIASALFLASLLNQLDGIAQTAVSLEQTTIAMNCPPSQLWAEIGREFQRDWVRDIPNRAYINVPPDVSTGERGSFQGHILEESQPTVTSTMRFKSFGEALRVPHAKYLVLLGLWGIVLSMATGAVAVSLAGNFATMMHFEISRSLLTVFALGASNVLAFRIGHLLWSRMYFKSRLIWIETEGTFQTSEIDVGNQLVGRMRSRNKLTRVENATLRVWVTDIVSVTFGKKEKRFVMAMAPADGYAKNFSDHLTRFAGEQTSIAVPTSARDLGKAKNLSLIEAEMGGDMRQAFRSLVQDTSVTGHVNTWSETERRK